MDFECKNYKDSFISILMSIGIIILYMIVPSLFLQIFLVFPFSSTNWGANICYIMAELCTLLILIFIFHKRFFRDFKDFKKNYKKYIKTAFKFWLIGFGLMIVSNLIINLFIIENGMAANESSNRAILAQFPLFSIVSMCIIGPICEELLFRASFKNAFKSIIKYSLFTGLLFAGMHVVTGIESFTIAGIIKNWQELLYFLPYGSLGIAFGYAYYKTDNIFTSIFMHIFHNSLSVLLIIFSMLSTGV